MICFFLQRICRHPQTQPRIIIPRTIVIQSCLLVEFLRVEDIRRIPDAVPLFNEHFAERHILDVLNHLAVQVGDVAAAAQVVGMVVELQLLVCVRILEVVFQCQSTGLRSLGRTVVAAELSCQRAKCKLVCRFPSAADNAKSNPCPST